MKKLILDQNNKPDTSQVVIKPWADMKEKDKDDLLKLLAEKAGLWKPEQVAHGSA